MIAIKEIVAQGERETLEFKPSFNQDVTHGHDEKTAQVTALYRDPQSAKKGRQFTEDL